MMHLLRSAAILFVPLSFVAAQDQSAENEILTLGDKLLGQAKSLYEKKDWYEAMELAERARTAFLALSELYASRNRSADLRKLNDSVSQCNQLVRLARDARKIEQDQAIPKPDPVAKKPDIPIPPGKPSPPPDAIPKLPEKLLPPDPDAQEKALKAIREVFEVDYAKNSPADRQVFARKLLKDAVATRGDRVSQFVLFLQARDIAAQAGDLVTAFRAIDAVAKEFAVDPLALKVGTLSKLAPTTTHDLAGPAVAACFNVVDDAVARDHYDLGLFVLKKAETLAKNPTNVSLQAKVQARAKDIIDLRKERENLRSAEKLLAEKPDDPAANLQVGGFLCFLKSDWARGLPMLRKGGDGNLGRIIETELAGPSSPELRMDLGDAWLKVAEADGRDLAKANLKLRARYWYEQALGGLTGFPRTRVQKLLEDLCNEEKAKWSTDLLPFVDPKKDSVAGDWKRDGSGLFSPATKFARLQLPFIPPEEYDLELEVTPQANHNAFVVSLVGGGRQFNVVIDAWETSNVGGIQNMDGKAAIDNETTFRGRVFIDRTPRTLHCCVRKTRVSVSVAGKTLIDWKADYKRLSVSDWWSVPNKRVPYLATGDVTSESMFQYRHIWFTPISGQGQKLR